MDMYAPRRRSASQPQFENQQLAQRMRVPRQPLVAPKNNRSAKTKKEHRRAPVVITGMIIAALLSGASVYAWFATKQDANTQQAVNAVKQNYETQADALQKQISTLQNSLDDKTKQISSLKETACSFTKNRTLKVANAYDIFGGEDFDAVVCGRIARYNEGSVEHVYFHIDGYADEKFKQALEKAIDDGNSVNKKDPDGSLNFSLGCIQNNDIVSDKLVILDKKGKPAQVADPMSPDVRSAILSSSDVKPIALVLSFQKHEGSECTCCNLAHSITLY